MPEKNLSNPETEHSMPSNIEKFTSMSDSEILEAYIEANSLSLSAKVAQIALQYESMENRPPLVISVALACSRILGDNYKVSSLDSRMLRTAIGKFEIEGIETPESRETLAKWTVTYGETLVEFRRQMQAGLMTGDKGLFDLVAEAKRDPLSPNSPAIKKVEIGYQWAIKSAESYPKCDTARMIAATIPVLQKSIIDAAILVNGITESGTNNLEIL